MAIGKQKWSKDELIIALDFYLRYMPSIPNKNTPEILALSDFLNRLQMKLGGEVTDKFRNPNGVYMKLMNFRRFDPSYDGKGLQRGGRDEEVVWNLYSSDQSELRRIAENIQSFIMSNDPLPPLMILDDDEVESEEGQTLTRIHKYRERDSKIVTRKKRQVLLEKGSLSCEACGFDFLVTYGKRGDGFIECHHNKPVSKMKLGEKTNIMDLALLCSNCHRMVHRRKPWLSVPELKDLLSN